VFGHMGRRRTTAILVSCAGAGAVLVVAAISAYGQENKPSEAERTALTAWDSIVTVLQHPRCMNCHQENVPLQGDERRVHIPLVVRGPKYGEEGAGEGVGAMRCRNCHNVSGNNETSGTPGGGNDSDERWRLPRPAMVWQNLSSAKLCNALKNRESNGDKSGPELVVHMGTPLVKWGWEPGGDRKPPPVDQKTFITLMNAWVDGGMPCPPN
jgi:hypothetical protein